MLQLQEQSSKIFNKEVISFNQVRYQVGKYLGMGLTAKVYLAESNEKVIANQTIAIKNVNCEYHNCFENEVNFLGYLNHPNIIKMIGYKSPTINDNRQMIALEYCEYDLFELVKAFNGLSETVACYFYVNKILPAVSYMHNQNICHRDLKLQNFLLNSNFEVKIADFSFGTILSNEGGYFALNEQCGSEFYVAPEIKLGIKYRGDQVDIYSLGVVLFSCVMNANPFPTWNHSKLLWKKPDMFWELFHKKPSAQFKNLIENMLAYEPQQRLTIQQILNHQWCQQNLPSEKEIKTFFQQNLF